MAKVHVAIVGGGIGGLSLALYLHRENIPCTVYEAVPHYHPLGVGINLLPHAARELVELGIGPGLQKVGVEPVEFAFYNRHGQLICTDPAGVHGGYAWPHLSMHRADLHDALLSAVYDRLGRDAVRLNHRCVGFRQTDDRVLLQWQDHDKNPAPSTTADVAVACDGVHSVIRQQLYPDEGPMAFAGINQWRGTVRTGPIRDVTSIIRCGSLSFGKFICYAIRRYSDGTFLYNWNIEVLTDTKIQNSWNQQGKLEDFLWRYENSHFDWLDIPAFLNKADIVLEYPMVDRDPLSRWSFGRVTLLGDAAHPMYPRGGNGGAQAILDGKFLAKQLKALDPIRALQAYEAERLPKTSRVVLTNRSQPPDYIIETVEARTEGQHFDRIEDVMHPDEMRSVLEGYQNIAGYDRATVNS
jgi:2-polyprenyl-6-methoxyphenol hydroxylase-like FAD-dependent oxidoreductase